MGERVVIVGGGHAGLAAAAALRRRGVPHPIIVVGEENVPPYDRPPLSKAWLKGELADERLWLRPPRFFAEKDIALAAGRRVSALDLDGRRVVLADGGEMAYTRLVLAMGSRARMLPAQLVEVATPAGAQRLHSLRSLADARRLKAALSQSGSLVVIGGGYIGLEVAASARAMGLAVTVIEAAEMVMPRLASPPVSRHFTRLHRSHGVEIRLASRLQKLTAEAAGVTAVLEDGAVVSADLALVGIGAVPDTALAESAGLACRDGILVDAQLRTSRPDVFAVGDVARLRAGRFGSIRLESIQNANDSAEVAARVIAGDHGARYDPVPWFWTEQFGLRLQSVGLAHGASQTLLRGNPEAAPARFSVLHLDEENRLLALDSLGTPRDFMQAKKLIEESAILDPRRAADPGCALKDAVVSKGA